VAFALPQPWLSQTPDMQIDESAKVYAVKGQDGRLVLSPGRGDRFTRSVWTEAWGRSVEEWTDKESLTCDLSGCVLRAEYGSAALVFDEVSVLEDCGRQDVMVATIPIGDLCNSGVHIDRFDLWRHGAHAVWLSDTGVKIERVSDKTGQRRWNRSTWRAR